MCLPSTCGCSPGELITTHISGLCLLPQSQNLERGQESVFLIKVLLVISTLEDYSQNLRVKAFRKQIILMKGITYYICTYKYVELGWRMCIHTCVWVTQSCLILCDPMDCSPPGSSAHGIFQARILEWVASSKGSSQPRDWTHFSCVSCIGRRILYHWHHLGLYSRNNNAFKMVTQKVWDKIYIAFNWSW